LLLISQPAVTHLELANQELAYGDIAVVLSVGESVCNKMYKHFVAMNVEYSAHSPDTFSAHSEALNRRMKIIYLFILFIYLLISRT